MHLLIPHRTTQETCYTPSKEILNMFYFHGLQNFQTEQENLIFSLIVSAEIFQSAWSLKDNTIGGEIITTPMSWPYLQAHPSKYIFHGVKYNMANLIFHINSMLNNEINYNLTL